MSILQLFYRFGVRKKITIKLRAALSRSGGNVRSVRRAVSEGRPRQGTDHRGGAGTAHSSVRRVFCVITNLTTGRAGARCGGRPFFSVRGGKRRVCRRILCIFCMKTAYLFRKTDENRAQCGVSGAGDLTNPSKYGKVKTVMRPIGMAEEVMIWPSMNARMAFSPRMNG